MANCINTSSKEFKALASSTGLHEGLVETLIYKYQNDNSTEKFPSQQWIQEQVTPKSAVGNSSQIEVFEKIASAYKSEGDFAIIDVSNESEFNTMLTNVQNVFSKGAVTGIQLQNGNYQIMIARPTVRNVEESFADTYAEHDFVPAEQTPDIRLKNLKSKAQRVSILNPIANKATTDDLWNIIRQNKDYVTIVNLIESLPKASDIYKRLASIKVSVDNVNIVDNKTLYESYKGKRAYYDATTRTIHIDANASYLNNDSSSVLLHELMHAITLDILISNPEQKAKLEEIFNVYEEQGGIRYKSLDRTKDHHLEEFVADIWSNADVINELKAMKATESVSLWNKLLKFFNNIFSGTLFSNIKEDSLLSQASQELINLLELPVTDQALGRYYEGPQLTTKEEKDLNEAEEFISKNVEFNNGVEALTKDKVLTKTEVREVATSIVNQFSDIVTELQEHQDEAIEKYKEFGLDKYKKEDFSSMSRLDVINMIGFDNLLNIVKSTFDPKNSSDIKVIRQIHYIKRNFSTLIDIAKNTFLENERLKVNDDSSVTTVDTAINDNADNFNEPQDSSTVAEIEGNLQEHWQVESRTLDIMNSMSSLVMAALNQCYVMENGEIKKNKWGVKERIQPREAVNRILRWKKGKLTLSDMVETLKMQQGNEGNEWLIQLIERLDNTGKTKEEVAKNADFQSQFFTVFNKDFQSYSVVTYDENTGKYSSMIVNKNPALKSAVRKVQSLFDIGEHPLFTSTGLNVNEFGKLQENAQYLSSLDFEKLPLNQWDDMVTALANVSAQLGYAVTVEDIESVVNADSFKKMIGALSWIIKILEENGDRKNYEPFNVKNKNSILGNVRTFLTPITEKEELDAITAFYDSGKMYQSYVTPSYTTKLFNKFSEQNPVRFEQFIQNEYANYSWFNKDGNINKASSWRNEWLRLLATDKDIRNKFAHKVQLNFNKKNYMRNLSDTEYYLSVLTEYFSERSDDKNNNYAWFRVPMLSNKPSSEFIRFITYRDSDYKRTLVDRFKEVFDQELQRIQTIKERRKVGIVEGEIEYIQNFDKKGDRFHFLDYLNKYIDGKWQNSIYANQNKQVELRSRQINAAEALGILINDKTDGKALTSAEETLLNNLAKEAIEAETQALVNTELQDMSSNGVSTAALNRIEGITESDLENFVWNDKYASMMIMQLMITDMAYYKNAEDIQKRLAQIHSPGLRGNAEAVDYDGVRVSDNYTRTIYLKDMKGVVSNVIENVELVFNKKIENAKSDSERASYEALKESLIKQWKDINVTDAQGYSSPSSYRKKAIMFGFWSKDAEKVYNKLINPEKYGKATLSEIEVAFQPLKPFVYTQISKPSGVTNGMNNLKVGIQNKNSEYLLIMTDALLRSEETGKPNLLKAIYDLMEKTGAVDKTKMIDTVQFESTVKTGLINPIDINSAKTTEEAISIMEEAITPYVDADMDSDGYNVHTVDTIPIEDYSIQQNIPEHFIDHEQAHGSQIRAITPSDLQEFDADGNRIMYDVTIGYDKDGKPIKKQLTAREFRQEFERTVADNIEESIETLAKELHLDSTEKKVRNAAIAKILQQEVKSSARYGIELLQAVTLDSNGDFNIPLGDPIQAKRIEQLLNSVIKNRVNKQEIDGGPVVQVSNFGVSRQLSIVFDDKQGNPLKRRSEFNGTDAEYKQYIKNNQGGIAYFEVLAPAYTRDFFSKFTDENGEIDVKAIEATDPELLEMVGYRIPTEDKYSAAPLKIVGFLPKFAGDGIMLPYDITLITGSDFDIDKEYLMRKHIDIVNKPRSEMKKFLVDAVRKSIEASGRKFEGDIKNKVLNDIDIFLDNPERTPDDAFGRKLAELYRYNGYKTVHPTRGKQMRNNKIVDMTLSVLRQETQADKILNVGGFDPQKRMGYLITAYQSPNNTYTWDELSKMSIDELKDLSYEGKNLTDIATHIQFYKQNAVAGSLIGIFAVSKSAHAILEGSGYKIDVGRILNGESFELLGTTFSDTMVIDPTQYSDGTYLGKALGNLVAASVDAVKDPILNLMNINLQTANVLNTMMRLGMKFEDAAIFLGQPVIRRLLENFNARNVEKYTSIKSLIDEMIPEEMKESKLKNESLTREELINNFRPETAREEVDIKTLMMFDRLLDIAEEMRDITFATRFNSIASAVGPTIVDNLILEHKIENFSDKFLTSEGVQLTIDDVFNDHPQLKQFATSVPLAETIFGNMPTNSTGFREVITQIPEDLERTFYGDRKLLTQLSDFYQSYMLIAKGVVDGNKVGYYINEFPKKFFNEVKGKYEDNAFINAIKVITDKKTGKAYLNIDTTGMENYQKQELSDAWADLYNENPELAKELFDYAFFRSGIGFSPKSYMSLLPIEMRKQIPGYIDTFKNPPLTDKTRVFNQFMRNNVNDSRLFKKRKVANATFKDNRMIVDKLANPWSENTSYLATTKTYWVKVTENDNYAYYSQVQPLGNNGEFLEMYKDGVKKGVEVQQNSQPMEDSGILSQQESDYEKQVKKDVLQAFMSAPNVGTEENAAKKIQEFKSYTEERKKNLESGMKKFFRNKFEQLGIKFDEKKINDSYNAIC